MQILVTLMIPTSISEVGETPRSCFLNFRASQVKHLLTLLTLLVAVPVFAQEVGFPYNPDANSDGFVGADDLLTFLSDFGNDADVFSCSRGQVCVLEYFSSGGYPNPLIFDLDESCTFVSIPGRPTTQFVRLPADSVEEGRVIDLVTIHVGSYTQGILVQALINDEWETIGSGGPSNGSIGCCCDPAPCVTHYAEQNPRLFRYVFNGSIWESVTIEANQISPTFE